MLCSKKIIVSVCINLGDETDSMRFNIDVFCISKQNNHPACRGRDKAGVDREELPELVAADDRENTGDYLQN